MDFKKLKDFIGIAKESGASSLVYENDDEKFSIKFPVEGSNLQTVIASTSAIAAGSEVQKTSQSTAPLQDNRGLIDITSPFVGTFYRSPSPDAEVYVKEGDRVSKGSVLCIVEAMKIMNEIESDQSGEIVEICVENETYVEYGQVLFRIKA